VRLLALSDLHVRHAVNREAVARLSPRPDDWLILAGDLGEREEDLRFVFGTLAPRFLRLLWVPGNHELWTKDGAPRRGVAHYEWLVALCREYGVTCPEDPYPLYEGEGGPAYVCPLFLLYDYSFRPPGMDREAALQWAARAGILCADEYHLHPDPYPSREAWCDARLRCSEERLAALPVTVPKVLVNHFPMRLDLVRLPRVPRFAIWCGTRRTEDWHRRFGALAVVGGHTHIRATDWRDGVRFEEVALGYPRHWRTERGADAYVREVLPGPLPVPPGGSGGPVFYR
jgi:3',5'-cyclic AMP phosphodiesterase CpdA